MKTQNIEEFLADYGLKLEDVLEPDLNKQREYFRLLTAILEADEPARTDLLNYAGEILGLEQKEKARRSNAPSGQIKTNVP